MIRKLLAELYYRYLNVEEDFFGDLFGSGETQMGRVFVNEEVIPHGVEVLDYERATEVIKQAIAHGRQRVLLPPQNACTW